MGTIIAVVAVFETIIESRAVATMSARTSRRGEVPTRRRTWQTKPVTASPKVGATPKATRRTGVASAVKESGTAPVSQRMAAKTVTPRA